jgi:hypothetical protein
VGAGVQELREGEYRTQDTEVRSRESVQGHVTDTGTDADTDTDTIPKFCFEEATGNCAASAEQG